MGKWFQCLSIIRVRFTILREYSFCVSVPLFLNKHLWLLSHAITLASDHFLPTVRFRRIGGFYVFFCRSHPPPVAHRNSVNSVLYVCPSIQLSVRLTFGIADKSFGRKTLHFGMLMYPDDLSAVYLCLWVLLSVLLFTTFSGLFAFTDKSLGRNVIEFGMLMYPDDLTPNGIDADGYCCHSMHSLVHPTVHELGF